MTCDPTPNAISSPEWGSGHLPCDALGGLTTAQFGRALVPANLSHRQAKAMGLETSGIYGPRSTISSRSAALRSFAENRLRARTDTLGSTLYKLTWKAWDTPSGRSFSLLRASAVRTKGTGHGGSPWVSPTAAVGRFEETIEQFQVRQDRMKERHPAHGGMGTPPPKTVTGGANSQRAERGAGGPDLQEVAQLAGWTTASARDWKDTPGMVAERADGKPRNDQLPRQAYLTGWPTPTEGAGKGGQLYHDGTSATGQTPDGRKIAVTLPHVVQLTTWPTPRAEDSESAGARLTRGRVDTVTAAARLSRWTTTDGPARLTASGEMLTGYSAQMDGGGQLNPEHARWLMACPSAWARSAPGWEDYAIWQVLISIASSEPKNTELAPCVDMETP